MKKAKAVNRPKLADIIASNRGKGTVFGQKAMLFALVQSNNLSRPVGVSITCDNKRRDGIFRTVHHMVCVGGGVHLGKEIEARGSRLCFECTTNEDCATVFLLDKKDLANGPWRERVEKMFKASTRDVARIALPASRPALKRKSTYGKRTAETTPSVQILSKPLSALERFQLEIHEARRLTGSVPCGMTLADFGL